MAKTNQLYAPVVGQNAEPARYGLLNSETLVTSESNTERWEGGLALFSTLCKSKVTNIEVCDASHKSVVQGTGSNITNTYDPFAVEVEVECSTFGFESRNYITEVEEAMLLQQGKAVEHEFWTGTLAKLSTVASDNPYLAKSTSTNVTPTPGTAVSVRQGFALLEGALASAGAYRGHIHAPRDVVSMVSDDLLVTGDRLETILGTSVSAGTGYAKTGPTGSAETGTKRWIYATGPVSVFLSDIDIFSPSPSETVDTTVNTIKIKAHRFAAPVIDGCGVFAVLVDLSS